MLGQKGELGEPVRIPYRDWCPLSEGDSCLAPAELQCSGEFGEHSWVPGAWWVLWRPWGFIGREDLLWLLNMSRRGLCHFGVEAFARQCLLLRFPVPLLHLELPRDNSAHRQCVLDVRYDREISLCVSLPLCPHPHLFQSLSHMTLRYGGFCYCSIAYVMPPNTECKWSF